MPRQHADVNRYSLVRPSDGSIRETMLQRLQVSMDWGSSGPPCGSNIFMNVIHLSLLPPIDGSFWWDDDEVRRFRSYVERGTQGIDRLPHPCYNRPVVRDAGGEEQGS